MFSYSSTNIRSINIAIKKRLKNMIFKYENYNDIPSTTIEYILSVSDAVTISDISLDDINSFLNILETED